MRKVAFLLAVILASGIQLNVARADSNEPVLSVLMDLQRGVKEGTLSLSEASKSAAALHDKISTDLPAEEALSLNAAVKSFERDIEELTFQQVCEGPSDIPCISAIQSIR